MMIKQIFGNREVSDWLNPVLVKELKQAVRSKQFVAVFVLVQIVMVLFVTLGMATATGSRDLEGMNQFFWTIVSIYLLGLLPMSGLNALAREYEDSRLDLLQLSSLSARGIVLGKWLSLNMQGWLVVLSLMPYIALRYFVGSVNPLHDLAMLGYLLYCSLIFSGAAICASVIRSKIVRILMLIAAVFGLFGLQSFITLIAFSMGAGMGMAGPFGASGFFSVGSLWVTIPLILLLSIPVGGLFLEFASARISPEAENHESPKRYYMLAILALTGVSYWLDAMPSVFIYASVMAMIPVAIGCITNEPIALPGIFAPFVRFGFFGRLFGRLFFYPGWPSGANFIVLLYVCAMLFNFTQVDPMGVGPLSLFLTSCLGALLLPRALTVLLKSYDGRMRFFMMIQMAMFCLVILVLIADSVRHWELINLLFFVPQAGIILAPDITSHPERFNLFMFGNIATAAISYAVILLGAWRFREPQILLEEHALEIVERKRAAKTEARAAESAQAAEA